MKALSHSEVEAFLHERYSSSESAREEALQAHLAACEQCAAYAANLAVQQPALRAALQNNRAFSTIPIELRARQLVAVGRRHQMQQQILRLAGGLATLILIVLIGAGLSGLFRGLPRAIAPAIDASEQPTVIPSATPDGISLLQNPSFDEDFSVGW